MTTNSAQSRVMNAAALVAGLFLVSRVLGFVRQAVFGYYFGTSLEAEAWAIVEPIPELIFNVIAGGALSSAFIPVFAEYFKDEADSGESVNKSAVSDGWELFSTVMTLVISVATVASVLVAVFTPQFLQAFYAPKLADSPELLGLTVPLLRVTLISPVIFGVTGVVMAALHGRHHFLSPAIAAVLFNFGILFGLLVWQGEIMGMAYGTVLGALAHVGIQLPALRRVGGRFTPRFRISSAVKKVMVLMAPRTLGLSFSHLNRIFTTFIAQTMVDGSMIGLGYANRIMLLPQGVLGMALGVASFPTFAALAAKGELAELREILSNTLRLILFLGLPSMVGLIVLRKPLVELAFQRGSFDETSTILTSWALLFYAFALVALALLEVIVRAFYALQDTVTPVLAGFGQTVIMLVLGLWLGRSLFPQFGWLGLGGVALAFSIANWFETIVLLFLLRRKMDGINGRHLLRGAVEMGVISAVMGVGVWVVGQLVSWSVGQLIVGGLVGALIYFLGAKAIGLPELGMILRRVPLLKRLA